MTPIEIAQIQTFQAVFELQVYAMCRQRVSINPIGNICYDENNIDVFGSDQQYQLVRKSDDYHVATFGVEDDALALTRKLAGIYAEYDNDLAFIRDVQKP